MGQSEVEKIAVEIYKKHKEALDIIFQYKPDIYLELSEFIQGELKKNKNIIVDSGGKALIRFTTKLLDSLIDKVGEGWTKSKRILMFEIDIYNDRVNLRLYIGPGDNDYREALRQFFLKQKDLFKLVDRKFGTKWHAVYQKRIPIKRDFDEKDNDELKETTSSKLGDFFEKYLPKIENYIADNWQKELNP